MKLFKNLMFNQFVLFVLFVSSFVKKIGASHGIVDKLRLVIAVEGQSLVGLILADGLRETGAKAKACMSKASIGQERLHGFGFEWSLRVGRPRFLLFCLRFLPSTLFFNETNIEFFSFTRIQIQKNG